MKYKSLYIHIPFCKAKCHYCAFYSLAEPAPRIREQFFTRLEEEFKEYASLCDPLDTLFIGGGTPSYLTEKELETLGRLIHTHFDCSALTECSLEANPESLTSDKIECCAQMGVNRISLGVQSFSDTMRTRIGRCGSNESIDKIIATCKKNNIHNISADLIYGIPGQTVDEWMNDVRRIAALPITHISCYALTVEEGSRLSQLPSGLDLNDDISVPMWKETEQYLLAHAHMFRYEISNYARRDYECRHNKSFWLGTTYLGCGPAAVSNNGLVRRKNPEDFNRWLERCDIQEETLSREAYARELLVLNLRTAYGAEGNEFIKHTGFDFFSVAGDEIEELLQEGFVDLHGNNLVATEKGFLFADHIAATLI